MIRLAKTNKTEESDMLEQIINLLKEHPVVKRLFVKYKASIDDIDDIEINFEKMDVSAKSKEGKITLNRNLLEGNNIIDALHYIIHELVHVLQFRSGDLRDMKHYDDEHYLNNPFEIEAFKEQIKFIRKYKDLKSAREYVDQLLDFHGYKGNEKTKKFDQLMGA